MRVRNWIFSGNTPAKTGELSSADAPRLSKAMTIVSEDLDLRHLWVIYPGKQIYRIAENITVFSLVEIPATWNYQ